MYRNHRSGARALAGLVMLPGLDGAGRRFGRFMDLLAPWTRVARLDYPADRPLGYEELEALLRPALPRAEPYVLLAESFGGPLAIRLAAGAPAGLRGLVLVNTFARMPYPGARALAPLAAHLPVKSLPRWLRAPLLWGSANPADATPAQLRGTAAIDAAVIRRRLRAAFAEDARAQLASSRLPVLVLRGRRDWLLPRRALTELHGSAPHAQVLKIDAPHLALQSNPRTCAAAVLGFLRKIASRDQAMLAAANSQLASLSSTAAT